MTWGYWGTICGGRDTDMGLLGGGYGAIGQGGWGYWETDMGLLGGARWGYWDTDTVTDTEQVIIGHSKS